ncbi:MAG: four helix bundle protein [Planctomycetota bacterium]
MSEFAAQMRERTKHFGLRVIKLVQHLKNDRIGRIVGNQLLRCGTSVGANYRAACRARSAAEFRAKLGIVEEECDEVIYWLEIIAEADLVPQAKLSDLIQEANEILAITVSSITTSKRNSN